MKFLVKFMQKQITMAQQTAIEWLHSELTKTWYDIKSSQGLLEQAKQMEKEQIINAVMYGLDEDGHTGDWKLSVTENYYNKTYNNGNSNTNL